MPLQWVVVFRTDLGVHATQFATRSTRSLSPTYLGK